MFITRKKLQFNYLFNLIIYLKMIIKLDGYNFNENEDITVISNGKGFIIFSKNNLYLKLYGDFNEEGNPDGNVKIFFKDGSLYNGGFKDNKYNGYGIFEKSNGDFVESNFDGLLFNGYTKIKTTIIWCGLETITYIAGNYINGKKEGKFIRQIFSKTSYCSDTSEYEDEYLNDHLISSNN